MDIFNKKKVAELEAKIEELKKKEKELLAEIKHQKRFCDTLTIKNSIRRPTLIDISTNKEIYTGEVLEPRYILQNGDSYSISIKKEKFEIPGQFKDFLVEQKEINGDFVSKEVILEYMSEKNYFAKTDQ